MDGSSTDRAVSSARSFRPTSLRRSSNDGRPTGRLALAPPTDAFAADLTAVFAAVLRAPLFFAALFLAVPVLAVLFFAVLLAEVFFADRFAALFAAGAAAPGDRTAAPSPMPPPGFFGRPG